MNKKTSWICGALLVLTVPGIAAAHPGHEAGAGFAAGVLHPLAGFDHLCALVAVGLLAGRLGGRAGAGVAGTFLALMAVGIAGGFAGLELPLVEAAIGSSIACIALLAWRPPRRLPAATAALAGLFAVFHGHAHAAEAVQGTARGAYSVGLLIASAGVMGAGSWLANWPAWNRLRLQRRRR
jgi:urease accessory protein